MDLTKASKSSELRISKNHAGCCPQSGLKGTRIDKRDPGKCSCRNVGEGWLWIVLGEKMSREVVVLG